MVVVVVAAAAVIATTMALSRHNCTLFRTICSLHGLLTSACMLMQNETVERSQTAQFSHVIWRNSSVIAYWIKTAVHFSFIYWLNPLAKDVYDRAQDEAHFTSFVYHSSCLTPFKFVVWVMLTIVILFVGRVSTLWEPETMQCLFLSSQRLPAKMRHIGKLPTAVEIVSADCITDTKNSTNGHFQQGMNHVHTENYRVQCVQFDSRIIWVIFSVSSAIWF